MSSKAAEPADTCRPQPSETSSRWLRWGIWAYFLFLIFEGALRKWVLPGLATPLLIIRDPLALALVVRAAVDGILPFNRYVTGVAIIGFLGVLTAQTMGHGNIIVSLFGVRILLVHFPLMFVIGAVFTREDVVRVGKATMLIAIPMTVLLGLQFYSPQSAWVNLGVGGDEEGAGFEGAMGYFRPPGTFSFTTGTTLFYGFAAPFIFYFWLDERKSSRIVLIAATLSLMASIPLSISRTLFFQVGLTVLFAMIAILRQPKSAGRLVLGAAAMLGGFGILAATSFFGTASEAFAARFEMANEAEGGMVEGVLVDRFLGGLYEAISSSFDQPFFGYGIGMGTNVGSQLLSGDRTFLISEGEWGRVVGELGALLGLLLIIFRVSLAGGLGIKAFRKLSQGDLLPWMLLSFGLITVAQGGWSQPTSLGFFVMIGGLLLASLKGSEPVSPSLKARQSQW